MARLLNARLFVIALLGLFITSTSFASANDGEKPVTEKKVRATLIYVYNNSSASGARDHNNWALTAPEDAPNCGTPGPVPCQATLDSSQYADMETYLDAQDFENDADVATGPGITSKQ